MGKWLRERAGDLNFYDYRPVIPATKQKNILITLYINGRTVWKYDATEKLPKFSNLRIIECLQVPIPHPFSCKLYRLKKRKKDPGFLGELAAGG